MTTISNNRRRKKISRRTAVLLVAAVLVLFTGLLWRAAAANLLWRIFTPLFAAKTEAAAGGSGFFAQFEDRAALARENAALKQELASSSAALVDRNFLYAENLQLKAMLGRVSQDKTLLATVIVRPPETPYGTLMLDVGSKSGVRAGDLVSAGGSAYIGRVSEAYDTASRVTLFSAPGQSYQGMLRGSVPVALTGEGSGSMEGQVPAGVDVSVGDPVLLPSIMPEFSALVTGVVAEEGESFQSVYLTLPANPLELRYLVVRLSPQS